MPVADDVSPSLRSLIVSWLSLTGWMLAACGAKARVMAETGSDAVKDRLLDLSCDPPLDDQAGLPGAEALPPLDPEVFAASLRGEVEAVLRRAAAAINEDPCGCWAAVTEERVQTLFAELGQEALARALDLRVAAAEAGLAPRRVSPGDWAKRYRRMKAAEGRWPPAAEEEDDGNSPRTG